MINLSGQTVMLLAILVSVLGSAWKISNGLTEVRERVSRLEGRIDTLESVLVRIFSNREGAP